MGVRELKEQALALYARRKYRESARTYARLLELEPKDPHLYVRHAEACRRAGDRLKAITSYRMAADMLLSMGCEARARAALKVALELNPRDAELAHALARLTPSHAPRREEVHLVNGRELLELHTRPATVPGRLALPLAPARPPAPLPSPAEVRRLSAHTLAVRASPDTRWLVVSSRTPLTAYEVDDLARVVAREFTLEPSDASSEE